MKFIGKLFLLFLIICMIQKPEFIFIPHSNNMFFGFIGFLVYSIDKEAKQRISQDCNISFTPFLQAYFPVLVIAIFSVLINFSLDLQYVKYLLTIFCAFYASYLIARLSYFIYNSFNIYIFLKYLIFAELIYLLISFLMFCDTSLYQTFTSIIKMDDIMQDAFERTQGFRIQGFGASFFAAGLLNGYFLIILSIYLSFFDCSTKNQIIIYFVFFITFIIGMMMARTTLVGAALAFGIIFLSSSNKIFKLLKTISIILCIIGILLFVISKIAVGFEEEFELLTKFAFEMFINYFEGNSMTTTSSEKMMDMYNIVPQDLKSWIIGDAKWSAQDGYYKNVDIGYLRNIWYFGVIGLLFLVRYYYRTLYVIFVRNRIFGKYSILVVYVFMAYVLILNAKGPADLFFYVIPFYFCCKPLKYDLYDSNKI